MSATYQVELGSLALAASTALAEGGRFFGLRLFDSGIGGEASRSQTTGDSTYTGVVLHTLWRTLWINYTNVINGYLRYVAPDMALYAFGIGKGASEAQADLAGPPHGHHLFTTVSRWGIVLDILDVDRPHRQLSAAYGARVVLIDGDDIIGINLGRGGRQHPNHSEGHTPDGQAQQNGQNDVENGITCQLLTLRPCPAPRLRRHSPKSSQIPSHRSYQDRLDGLSLAGTWFTPGRGDPEGAPSHSLDDQGVGHAAALTHRLKAITPAGPLQLPNQGGEQARSGCT